MNTRDDAPIRKKRNVQLRGAADRYQHLAVPSTSCSVELTHQPQLAGVLTLFTTMKNQVRLPSHSVVRQVSGRSYAIERALAVTGPWSILTNRLASPGSEIDLTDTSAPVSTAFYRATSPIP